jgi:hypothetical protein
MEINASSPAASAVTMKRTFAGFATPCVVPGLDCCGSHSLGSDIGSGRSGDRRQIQSERGDLTEQEAQRLTATVLANGR